MHILLACAALCMGLGSIWLLTQAGTGGRYTSIAYDTISIVQILQVAVCWREFLVSGWGPLGLVAGISFAVRIVVSVRTRQMPNSLRWRIAIAAFGVTWFCVLSGWPMVLGRYALPGVAFLNIIAAIEIGELWALCRPKAIETKASSHGRLAWGLYMLLLMLWIAPPVVVPIRLAPFVLRCLLWGLFLWYGTRALRVSQDSIRRDGTLPQAFRYAGRCVIWAGLAIFILSSAVGLYSEVSKAEGIMKLRAHKRLLDSLRDKVPAGGRVIYYADTGYLSSQLNTLKLLYGFRPDIEFVRQCELPEPNFAAPVILPSDTLILFEPMLEYYDLEEPPAKLLKNRQSTRLEKHHAFFNLVWAQPGRQIAHYLGWANNEMLPLHFKRKQIYASLNSSWRIYWPSVAINSQTPRKAGT